MTLDTIRKRNGMLVPFDSAKISNAIQKGMIDAQYANLEDAANITQSVQAKLLEKKDKNPDYIPSVEEIQDIVEESLMDA